MPVAFDPQEVFRFVFSTDRQKPVEERPTLLFHFPTCREQRQIGKLFDEAKEAELIVLSPTSTDAQRAKAFDEQIAKRCAAIRVILCGWNNFKDRAGIDVSYDPAQLDAVLTDWDFVELETNLLRDMSISEREKKVSALSLPSNTAGSVASATASA